MDDPLENNAFKREGVALRMNQSKFLCENFQPKLTN
jgi:hypothetical protein